MSFADRLAPEDVTGWTEALEASTQTTEAEAAQKKVAFSELLGYALGVMCMKLDDFVRLTPDEFWHV